MLIGRAGESILLTAFHTAHEIIVVWTPRTPQVPMTPTQNVSKPTGHLFFLLTTHWSWPVLWPLPVKSLPFLLLLIQVGGFPFPATSFTPPLQTFLYRYRHWGIDLTSTKRTPTVFTRRTRQISCAPSSAWTSFFLRHRECVTYEKAYMCWWFLALSSRNQRKYCRWLVPPIFCFVRFSLFVREP